jgi:hypothetical protein
VTSGNWEDALAAMKLVFSIYDADPSGWNPHHQHQPEPLRIAVGSVAPLRTVGGPILAERSGGQS